MPTRILIALAALVLACPAAAQTYPSRPVKVVVTFPPGGTPDIYGRIMSVELSKLWGQPVVVENRTGAGGTIGTDSVAKSAPDGYTLLFAADATITIAPHLYGKLPYDPQRDLAPIVNVTAGPFVLMANPAFGPGNVKELIDLVRARTRGRGADLPGLGAHQHVPIRSVGPAAGRGDTLHDAHNSARPGVRAWSPRHGQ